MLVLLMLTWFAIQGSLRNVLKRLGTLDHTAAVPTTAAGRRQYISCERLVRRPNDYSIIPTTAPSSDRWSHCTRETWRHYFSRSSQPSVFNPYTS